VREVDVYILLDDLKRSSRGFAIMSYAGCHGGDINYYAQNVSLVVEGTTFQA